MGCLREKERAAKKERPKLAAIFPAVLVCQCGVHSNAIFHLNIAKISAKHQSFDLKQQNHKKNSISEQTKQLIMKEKMQFWKNFATKTSLKPFPILVGELKPSKTSFQNIKKKQ